MPLSCTKPFKAMKALKLIWTSQLSVFILKQCWDGWPTEKSKEFGRPKQTILYKAGDDPIEALTELLGSVMLSSVQTVFGEANLNDQLILRIDPLLGSDIITRLTHPKVNAPLCGSAIWGSDRVVWPNHTCQLSHMCWTAICWFIQISHIQGWS